MTSYDDTKVQLTINRMTQECYDNLSGASSKELYLISENPNGVAKIDLDAQGAIESEISALSAQTLETFSQIGNDISALSAWNVTQDSLISELSTQTVSNSTDISALGVEIQEVSANMSKSIIRRWEPVAGLRFVAGEANSTMAMAAVGSAPSVSLEYNTGDRWNDFIVGETTVTLENVGDECYIRAKTANRTFGTNFTNYNKFVMTGKMAAYGSIMYLLKNDGDLDTLSSNNCFIRLFRDCTSLTTPPELPATTLTQYCYYDMFRDCTSLTSAPELPATTLAERCYPSMFRGCTSLTTAPELPATTLTQSCYYQMFYGCTSLTSAPELPATTLAADCYSGMFDGCTSLTSAPELPAITLAVGCYQYMFSGCSSLVETPELPATTLTSYCYYQMFYGCTSLNTIKIGYTGNFSGTGVPAYAFTNWVNGVSASGTFYYDGEDTTRGNSAIPTGWNVEPLTPPVPAGFRFVAEEANSTVAMSAVGSAPSVSLEYNTGDGWNDFVVGTTTVTLANVGDECYIRAKTANSTFGTSGTKYNKFVMTGKIAAYGSIMYLLKNDGDLDTLSSNYCFFGMFYGCTSLTTAPELPATTLTSYCYSRMFSGCTSLTTAPKLPAITLAVGCYSGMFDGCTSLTSAPELPATTLASHCYSDMFYGCTSLTSAPELPATTLAANCFLGMFYGCTSLTTAPELPAITLAYGCYSGMFYGCTSLTTAPELPATTLASYCYNNMFCGCTSLTTAPELPATTLTQSCYYQMFYVCTSLNTIKIGYTGNFSGTGVPTNAFSNWVTGVSSNGTFYYNGSDTTRGASAIPNNWTIQTF